MAHGVFHLAPPSSRRAEGTRRDSRAATRRKVRPEKIRRQTPGLPRPSRPRRCPGTPGAIAVPPTVPRTPPWKARTYGGFTPITSATLPGKMSLNSPKPGSQHGIGRKLPRQSRSWLPDRERRGGENISEAGLNRGIERLIHVMRDRIEGSAKPRDFVVRIQRIRIERVPHADRPRQLWRELPRILRIEIEIQKIERLVWRKRKCLRRRIDATP